jgi:hypothetical protein
MCMSIGSQNGPVQMGVLTGGLAPAGTGRGSADDVSVMRALAKKGFPRDEVLDHL